MAACRQDGFPGLRVAVDMSWALHPVAGVEHICEVLDAPAIGQGPVAVVPLPRRVPFGFHGSWVASNPG